MSVNKALGKWQGSIPTVSVSFRRLDGQAKVGLQVKQDSSVMSHSHIEGVYVKTEGCNGRVLPEVGETVRSSSKALMICVFLHFVYDKAGHTMSQ